MDVDSNEILAAVYQPGVRQIVVIYPVQWMHDADGDWFIRSVFEEVYDE